MRKFEDAIDNYLEPPVSEEPIGQDFLDHDVYGDEQVYVGQDIVFEDDFDEYVNFRLKKYTLLKLLSEIQNLSSLTVKSDVDDLNHIRAVLTDILEDKITEIGVATYFDLTEQKASEAV